MMRALLCIALGALSGCSLWNAPDPGLLDAGDAGVIDAGDGGGPPPDDAPDAPFDAPMPRGRETMCADDRDDDGDGAVDCVDTDCASEETCCTVNDAPVVEEDWCTPVLPDTWTAREGTLIPVMSGGACTVGGSGTGPNVAFYDACVPLAAGATFHLSFDWSGGDCADCEAMVALSPVADAGPAGIVEDLAVRMRGIEAGGLEFQLTRAGTILARFGTGVGPHELDLVLFPALSDAGEPVLRALLVSDATTYGPFDALDFPAGLLGQPECPVAPGLFLGVETRGLRARVGSVSVQTAQCANPNYFRPVGGNDATWLEASDLGFTAAHTWTAGGIGSSSVVPVQNGATVQWTYFVDGSPTNRANDRDTDLDFAVGGVRAPSPGIASFELRSSGAPLVSAAGACGVGCDVRDPSAFFPRDIDGEIISGRTGQLFWTQRDDETMTSRIMRADFSSPNSLAAIPTVATEIATGCAFAERPSLLTANHAADAGGGGHLLVFLCDGALFGLPLTYDFVNAAVAPTRLLTAAELGFSRGLVDVDGAVFGSTYRVWVAGRDARGLTRIALAEGTLHGDDDVPVLVPFAGNPILSIDDPLLDACDGTCTITGVGVGRLPGNSRTVRVVLSVSDEGSVVRHVLIPLEQDMPVAPVP